MYKRIQKNYKNITHVFKINKEKYHKKTTRVSEYATLLPRKNKRNKLKN